jgi:type I restriction enzyme M protein
MLESETKRRIDTARDILVGKVPDPKSQVEQITIALIYKFMDDMDRESKEMGGKAVFFTGEFKRYRWSNIFDPRLGGHEMLNLYAEAIVKLNQNPGIPQLFRDIFKNAYLPYRDPETLKLFLTTINEFKYDHSENLGDAFEYLLSVLGSQGDAGQFRTPRNIINFMVEVIDPRMNEIILDPACGTAGFLISSYKHIMKANTKKALGDLLTTSERKKMMDNFRGYDISPDMVRLSLVNLYLHGFSQPKIFEYDTLTSDERWNEYAGVILANPPFMSPKGGIKPHKKFSVQSNRSEVLFVDYIAEHLTTSGRAAVIVPEGIIFQGGTAYKQLRKSLVEKYLYAVVSLPSGVFNPYAGVKTSVLFFDPLLAQKSDSILFVKIENDGFSLGAQRRAIDKNDLPMAVEIIKKFRKELTQRRIVSEIRDAEEKIEEILPRTTLTDTNDVDYLIVSKEKLAENDEYNLTGERYRETEQRGKQKWSMVRLGDVDLFSIESGGTPDSKNKAYWDGDIYWATLVDLPQNDYITIINDTQRKITQDGLKNSSAKIISPNSVIVSTRATIGRIGINKISMCTNQGFKNVIIKDESKVSYAFLAFMIKQLVPQMELLASGGTFKEISKTNFCSLEIPLPPIEIQREIVAEIEGYQKIIDGARKVVDNWKPHIDIDPDWSMVKLGDMCDFMTGGTPFSSIKEYYENGVIPWIVSGDIHKGEIFDCKGRISEKGMNNSNTKFLPVNSVLIALNGQGKTRGTVALLRIDNATCNQSIVSMKPKTNVLLAEYLYYLLKAMYQQIRDLTGDNQRSGLNIPILKGIQVPLPPIEVQQKIVAEIEAEQKTVDGCRELIALYEGKIKTVIEHVWGGMTNEV